MKKVRITAVRKNEYTDLMEKYENPIEHACDLNEGDEWISVGGERPDGLGEYVSVCSYPFSGRRKLL